MKKSLYTKEYKAIVNALCAIRVEKGMRQTDLAIKLRVPQSFVSKYETGERRLDVTETREICRCLGVTLTDLLKRAEQDY